MGASKEDYTTRLNIKPGDEIIKLRRIIMELKLEIEKLELELLYYKSEEQ
jgi:hypothetical protein